MDFKRFHTLPEFGTNTYLVWEISNRKAILIDPGAPSENIISYVSSNSIEVTAIVNTHGHADHIGGNDFFHQAWHVPIYIHKADAEKLTNPELNLSEFMGQKVISPTADRLLEEGDLIKLGNKELEVIHTPGHTSGGICLLHDLLLFSGDTLFRSSIGRTDFPDSDYKTLINSIKTKLYKLPDHTMVCPGHFEETIIGIEKKENPFIRA